MGGCLKTPEGPTGAGPNGISGISSGAQIMDLVMLLAELNHGITLRKLHRGGSGK